MNNSNKEHNEKVIHDAEESRRFLEWYMGPSLELTVQDDIHIKIK